MKQDFLESTKNLDTEDLSSSRNVVTVFSIIHLTSLSFYVCFVTLHYDIYYGFENIENLPKSIFIDLTISFFHVLMYIQLFRIVLFILYQLLVDFVRYSYVLFSLHLGFNLAYLVFDIFYIVVLMFYGWNCNSSLLPVNPCNDPFYCKAFGNLFPNLCLTEDYIALPPYRLESRLGFTIDFWFTVGFFILDLFQYFNVPSIKTAIIKFYFNNNNGYIFFKNTLRGNDFYDITSSKNVITISNIIHFTILSVYTILVFLSYDFYYGFENIENTISGFVDRRFSFIYVILVLQMFRVLLYMVYQWTADTTKYYELTYTLHKTLNVFYIVVDVIYIIVLIFNYIFCNNTLFPDNPCNDPRFCQIYGNQFPDLCRTEDYNPVPGITLQQRINFVLDIYFTIYFLVTDIIQLFVEKSLNMSINRLLAFSNNKQN